MPITNTIFFIDYIRAWHWQIRTKWSDKEKSLSVTTVCRMVLQNCIKNSQNNICYDLENIYPFFFSQNFCLFQQSKQNKSFWLNQISQIIVYFCLFCMWFETIYKQNTLTNMNVNKIIWCWLLPSRWFLYRIIGLINQRQFFFMLFSFEWRWLIEIFS